MILKLTWKSFTDPYWDSWSYRVLIPFPFPTSRTLRFYSRSFLLTLLHKWVHLPMFTMCLLSQCGSFGAFFVHYHCGWGFGSWRQRQYVVFVCIKVWCPQVELEETHRFFSRERLERKEHSWKNNWSHPKINIKKWSGGSCPKLPDFSSFFFFLN